MVLVIDNYDSFTYNIVQLLGSLGAEVRVFRNDAINAAGVRRLDPKAMVISPGGGRVDQTGGAPELVRGLIGPLPMLGICLGHQMLAEAFGAKVVRSREVMHGRVSEITHDGKGVFQSLPQGLKVMRYHSWTVDQASLPTQLVLTAHTTGPEEERELMGLRHLSLPITGLQFHPESFLTKHGATLLRNFLESV